jgi:hypothetical protein
VEEIRIKESLVMVNLETSKKELAKNWWLEM